jgi:hypothetical protein
MNIAFLCNTDQKISWYDLLPQNGDFKTEFCIYGTPEHNKETMERLSLFKPDVIHLHWREHRDFKDTVNFIRKLREKIKVPLMLQMDYQPRYIIDQDLEFANLGDILISENILVNDFAKQPGITVPTCYIGAAEWGADCPVLFQNSSWIAFKDVYDTLAGQSIVFGTGGFMDYDKKTKKYTNHVMKVPLAKDRKKLWVTCWHDRPEMPMIDKFKMMNILGKEYKCRWFNGWEANTIHQMHAYAAANQVPQSHYEAYEWMGLGYWEMLSECMCSVDNMYWGTCSLGFESAALKIPLTGNSLCTTAVIMNPKLVTDDIEQQAGIVRWLLDNPDEAIKLGQEAYDNHIEHFTIEKKMERFNEALKLVGLK